MADNELTIFLRLVTASADAADAAYHTRARRRIKDTAAEQDKSDKDYIKAIKLKERAFNDFSRELETRFKATDKERIKSDDDYVRAVKKNLDSTVRLQKEATREKEKSEADYVRAVKKNLAAQVAAEKDVEGGILNIAKAYTVLRIASEAGQFAAHIMQTIGDEANRSRSYIDSVVDSMRGLRGQMVELMHLRGENLTGATGAAVIAAGGKLGLTPAQTIAGETAFESRLGHMIGPEGKMTRDQASELKSIIMPAAAKMGVGQDAAINLLETMVMTEPVDPKTGKISTEKILKSYGQAIRASEVQPGKTAPQMIELSRSLKETKMLPGTQAQWMAFSTMMAQNIPEEEHTYVRAWTMAMANLKEDQFAELGIDPKADPLTQSKQLSKKWQEEEKGEGDKGTVHTFLRESGFRNIRGRVSAIMGIDAQRGGQFDQTVKQIMQGRDIRAIGREQATTQIGLSAGAESDLAAERMREGQVFEPLKRIEDTALARLIGKREFSKQHGLFEAELVKQGQKLGAGDLETAFKEEVGAQSMRDYLIQQATTGTPQAQRKARAALAKFTSTGRIDEMTGMQHGGELGDLISGRTSKEERGGLARVVEELQAQSAHIREQNELAKKNAVQNMTIPMETLMFFR